MYWAIGMWQAEATARGRYKDGAAPSRSCPIAVPCAAQGRPMTAPRHVHAQSHQCIAVCSWAHHPASPPASSPFQCWKTAATCLGNAADRCSALPVRRAPLRAKIKFAHGTFAGSLGCSFCLSQLPGFCSTLIYEHPFSVPLQAINGSLYALHTYACPLLPLALLS